MTNKAKTYLKNIQEADTEKKLIGIEIAFKQDMTLSCSDLGSLCRAAEDRRYSLRNNVGTLKLKQILFFRTKAEMDAYHDMSRKPKIRRKRRSSSKEAASAAFGRSSRKRNWSMSTRLGRKPTPTPNSPPKGTRPEKGLCLVSNVFLKLEILS